MTVVRRLLSEWYTDRTLYLTAVTCPAQLFDYYFLSITDIESLSRFAHLAALEVEVNFKHKDTKKQSIFRLRKIL